MLAVILPYIPFSGLIGASRDCTEHSCMLNVREAFHLNILSLYLSFSKNENRRRGPPWPSG